MSTARFEVLGPLRVVDDGGNASSVSAHKVRVLLAALLVRSGQVVSSERLIEEIWGENPPRRAVAGLHVYVSNLRKFLTGTARNSRIVTRPPGYLLDVGDHELDVHEFQRLVFQGRAHARAQRHADAVGVFAEALALWRGTVLGDLRDGAIVGGFAQWLEESNLECTELFVESNLALGRHREMVGRLHGLVAGHPLREAFYRQLMLALHHSGRRAEALEVYQVISRRLVEEIGLQPCRALQDLRRSILAADSRREARLAV